MEIDGVRVCLGGENARISINEANFTALTQAILRWAAKSAQTNRDNLPAYSTNRYHWHTKPDAPLASHAQSLPEGPELMPQPGHF